MNRSPTQFTALAVAAIAAPTGPAQQAETRDVQEPRSDLTIDMPGAVA